MGFVEGHGFGGALPILCTGTMGKAARNFPCGEVAHSSSPCTIAIGKPALAAASAKPGALLASGTPDKIEQL